MVFRKDSKVDAFQRQISALRQQLGGEAADFAGPEHQFSSTAMRDTAFRSDIPDLAPIAPAGSLPSHGVDRHERPEASHRVPAVPAVDMQTSIVAHSTIWTGALESTGSLHVHGRVEGTLTARDDIFIAEEADVDAVVRAANVTIAGNVRGSIQCSDRFEVLPRGRVVGDIQSPVIVIHEGAMIAGDIAMSRAGEAAATPPSHLGARAARGGA